MSHRLDVNRWHVWQIALLVFTCIWGVDYLMGPPKYSMYLVEHTMPLPLWGLLLLFFGVMGLLGEVWMEAGRNKELTEGRTSVICRAENRWWPSFTAHAVLCAMCMGMGVGGVAEMIINEHMWGLRVPGFVFLLAVAHWVFVQRRKSAP